MFLISRKLQGIAHALQYPCSLLKINVSYQGRNSFMNKNFGVVFEGQLQQMLMPCVGKPTKLEEDVNNIVFTI